MTTVIHTPECIAATAQRTAEIAAWEAQWPNCCRSCWGNGGRDYPSHGDDPGDYEPCQSCWLKCPRCGKPVSENVSEGDASCPHCGRTSADYGRPEPIDGPCSCAYDAWAKEEQEQREAEAATP